MGINVLVETVEGEPHPDWDFIRVLGDRDIPRWFASLPQTTHPESDRYCRPSEDLAVPPDCPNPERWQTLLDIVRSGPKWWVYFSV